MERAGLGGLKLDAITTADVNKFLTSAQRVKGGKDRPLGPKTKRATVVFLSGLFESGMSDVPKRCLENPLTLKSFHKPKLAKSSAARDLLTQAETSAVLDQCPDKWALFFWLLGVSGARIGEVGAARWSDLDLDLGVLTIRRTFYRGTFGPTKSGEEREVDLPDQILGALARYRTETFGAGPVDPDRLLFPGRTGGQPLDQTHARRVWAEASRKAGVRYRKPHALRHMWASVALKQSGDVKWVQGQLGHASAKLTLDTYGHVLRERRRERVSAIEASLGFRDGSVMATDPKPPAMASEPVDASARGIERPETAEDQ